MNFLDELPQRTDSHDTAEAAETAFRSSIEACDLFVVQQVDRNDYGTDVQIEARDGNAMTNNRAHVQLKGTKCETNSNGSVSVKIFRTNLNYLLTQADSMYVCYHLPTKRLLVRYADDVYHDYEHRGEDWIRQKEVTVNFSQPFNEQFQRCLNARLLESGRASRDRRLQWIGAPPEQIPTLVQNTIAIIEVPTDSFKARGVLVELYGAGYDRVISNSFAQFEAVLDSLPGGMVMAYMAEINLGVNREPFDKDRVRQSVKVLGEAMESGEFHPGSLQYCLGNAWLALGKYQNAQEAYRLALNQLDSPEFSDIVAQCCKNLGSALKGLGEMEQARIFYERALEFDPDLSEAHFALALWHRGKGDDPHQALDHLDRVVRQGGSAVQMSTVQAWRIDLLFNIGDTEGAFREINNLVGLENRPEWVWPWCANHVAQFGKACAETARKALRFWRVYISEHPRDTYAERERLLCLWRLHDSGAPVEINFDKFRHAVFQLIDSGEPNPAFMWDRVGHWAQVEGDWAQAESAYREACNLEPERYGYCLGTALNFLGRYQEALSILLPQAEEHLPDAKSWFQVAIAREGVGDIKECILAYKRTLKIDSEYELAWFNLGSIYWNSQDTDRAAETWGVAVTLFPDHALAKKLRQELPFLFETDNNEQKA